MRIVLAPDSFKESMTAREAARAMAEGVKDADPRARTVQPSICAIKSALMSP